MNGFTSVNRVIAELYSIYRGTDLHESDIIGWIGEGLEHIQVFDNFEQVVRLLEVENFECELPIGTQMLMQVAYDMQYVEDACTIEEVVACCVESSVEEAVECPVVVDCQGKIIGENYEPAYYRPYYDLKWEHSLWYSTNIYAQRFAPIRLSNNIFFKDLVSQEKDVDYSCNFEYTVVGTTERKLRFSFEKGQVAVAYLKTPLDEDEYPLVPDEVNTIAALKYFVQWKIEEYNLAKRREGSMGLVQYYENHWLKYCRQAKSYHKMPKTIDQMQNMLEQSHYLIPRHKRYYGFFGNLGREEQRGFNNPDLRKKLTR